MNSTSNTDCVNGGVQLVGGNNSKEGTVHLCLGNVWGTICNQGWNESAATRICTQLFGNQFTGSKRGRYGREFNR